MFPLIPFLVLLSFAVAIGSFWAWGRNIVKKEKRPRKAKTAKNENNWVNFRSWAAWTMPKPEELRRIMY